MADTKTLFTQRFDAARTAWTEGDEAAAAEFLRAAIATARADSALQRELASALFNLGKLSRKSGPAGEIEAGLFLTEALEISGELFGNRDAALVPLLHELSRLYLQQSKLGRAEDALERLLDIARAKGPDHPEVANALADLAFLKRKLGDDASAEALYRDALRIREKTLEPNHSVTVGTLERLSETCAARGNYVEALALLRRALPAREAALGAGHDRVRAARARVAELELQIANTAATENRTTAAPPRRIERVPDFPADTPSTPARPSINSKDLQFLGDSEPRAIVPSARPREWSKTPTVAAAVAASLIATSIPTPSASQIAITQPESARSSDNSGRDPGTAQRDLVYADAVSAGVSQPDAASSDAGLDAWQSAAAFQTDSPELARKKRTRLYASAGVGVIAMAMAGLLMSRPRAARNPSPVSKEMRVAQTTTSAIAPVVTTAPTATRTVSTAGGATALAPTHSGASATPASNGAAIQPSQDDAKNAPAQLRAPRVEVHLDSAHMPTVPATPSVEALLRPATERQRASDTDRAEPKTAVSLVAPADVASAHTSPKIIGRVPDPGFPDALLRSGTREGQVVVRFMVNELGKVDVATMVVEQSDDELFTAAVREVLPLFRFEPARTLGPESKPVPAWVSVPFRFTTKKK